jgi:hypothetical protein
MGVGSGVEQEPLAGPFAAGGYYDAIEFALGREVVGLKVSGLGPESEKQAGTMAKLADIAG